QPDQYWNMNNPQAHERTTGPEIWRQTEGRVTHVVVASGTGGTISGIGRYLKAQNPAIQMVGADPEGSVLSGDTARPYLTEGIGEDFFPGTYDKSVVDRWVRVSDRDAFAAARRITREEGILAGESCGTALVATLTVAHDLMAAGDAADKVIVVIFPDGGRNYLSKLYNDEWLRINGLLGSPSRVSVADVLRNGHQPTELPAVVLARTTDKVADAIATLERYGISQMPVTERDDQRIEGIVGSINEKGLLERAYRKPEVVDRTVGEVMDKPLPTVRGDATVDEAFELLAAGAPALVAVVNEEPLGVITKLDLLEYLARGGKHGA
ncbi:MAG: pyridoxal-phosphate dependent enzyme, partial [Chloroflexota bacterium]